MKIALTGGIACGKSLAASYAAAQGVAVCDADTLAHQVLTVGTDVYRAVVKRFGSEILDASGEIDRPVLAQRVFACEADRVALNALVHPAVKDAWTAWLAAQPPDGMAMVVVPLLYEAGFGEGWDAVMCVSASDAIRRERLTERGLSVAEATVRMQAQWPEARKTARADYVLWNDGTAECLTDQVARVLDHMKRGQ